MRRIVRGTLGVAVAITACGVMTLSGCGGGGGGGDDGGQLPNFLALSQSIFFGTRTAGSDTLTAFPTLPTTGVPIPQGGINTVAGAQFPAGVGARQDFIQLTFNNLIDAASISSNPPNGNDGIVIFRRLEQPAGSGTFVSVATRFLVDAAGTLDPANAFPQTGVAPATLRLYVSSDDNVQTAEAFLPGQYTLAINNTLRSFNGGPFCVTGFGANCVNSYLPVLPFTVDADTSNLSLSATAPTIPLQADTAVPINSEITINFSKAVNFAQLVGQTTTLDPFISVPRSVQYVIDCNDGIPPTLPPIPQWQNIGNFYLNYNRALDPLSGFPDLPPANLGFVIYMPDPFLNPTQVRVRFVDISTLVGTNNPAAGVFQNYASNPTKLPIPSSNPALNNAILQRPNVQPTPGSLPGYNPNLGFQDTQATIVDIVILSPSTNDPDFPSPPFPVVPVVGGAPGNRCYQNAAVGSFAGGAQDRFGNQFRAVENPVVENYWVRFAWAPGPALSRNPNPPDAVIVASTQGTTRGIACINTATVTTNNCAVPNTQIPVASGGQIVGTIVLMPNRLQNSPLLGAPRDVEIGSPLNPGYSITNPGRGSVNFAGTPDTQNGTTLGTLAWAIAGCPNPPPGGPAQPWGHFLYVVDSDAQSVKVFNSYNFTLISTLTGVPSPGGLGISPNLEFLYVANEGQGTVQRVFAVPASPNFHTVAGTIPVGNGPQAVSVQPANEDVFVANFAGNSFSIIDTGTQQVRANFADPGAIGPSDIFITNRMLGNGLTNAYMAFICNFFSDDITVYESDSAAVPENSLQGVIKASQSGFQGPRRGTWNFQTYIGLTTEPGCFVANTLGNTIDEFTLTNFTLSPPPNFPGPAGQRTFRTFKQFTNSQVPGVNTASPSDIVIDNFSSLNNNNDNKGSADASFPSVILISYPAAGVVGVFSYNSAGTLYSALSVPGCDFMHTYYDQ